MKISSSLAMLSVACGGAAFETGDAGVGGSSGIAGVGGSSGDAGFPLCCIDEDCDGGRCVIGLCYPELEPVFCRSSEECDAFCASCQGKVGVCNPHAFDDCHCS